MRMIFSTFRFKRAGFLCERLGFWPLTDLGMLAPLTRAGS